MTKKELILIKQIRKRSRSWSQNKYFSLIGGLVIIILWFVLYFFMFEQLKRDPEVNEFAFLCMLPFFLFSCLFGADMIGRALRDWHGNAVDILLLKLIDEGEQDDREL